MAIIAPTAPVQPEDLKDLIREYNAIQRAKVNAIRFGARNRSINDILSDNPEVTQLTRDQIACVALMREWYATDEGRAYKAACARYNAQVEAYRAAVKKARQTRKNTAEVAKVRAGACKTCFATHAGEC